MSRGFVKEDDQEDIPMVPPRAYLPIGVPNYVTQNGMDELMAERQKLVDEKADPEGINENEKRLSVNFINAKLQLLDNRIAQAFIVDLDEQPLDAVKFGATVTIRIEETQNIQAFQIVGVDEANISKGKISFISPVAKALMNKKAGDKISVKRPKEDITYEILDIKYSVDPRKQSDEKWITYPLYEIELVTDKRSSQIIPAFTHKA